MSRYSNEELYKRNKIIKSQLLLGNFLNVDIINKLIHLFDETSINSTPKIKNYIVNERKLRGLDNYITVTSEVYGTDMNNSTLHLQLKKDGNDFIHLSIHLVMQKLEPHNSGMIHIAKNIYKKKNIRSKKIKSYAIILVEQRPDKPNSLHFSIGDGYITPHVKNANIYDPLIEQEMDVIITVLNNIFDEDKPEFYIGIKHRNNKHYVNNNYKLYEPHKIINTILENMNTHSIIKTRNNKGRKMLPIFDNNTYFVLNNTIYKRLHKKYGKRVTSKKIRL
jgi:hypothetical protein